MPEKRTGGAGSQRGLESLVGSRIAVAFLNIEWNPRYGILKAVFPNSIKVLVEKGGTIGVGKTVLIPMTAIAMVWKEEDEDC